MRIDVKRADVQEGLIVRDIIIRLREMRNKGTAYTANAAISLSTRGSPIYWPLYGRAFSSVCTGVLVCGSASEEEEEEEEERKGQIIFERRLG